MKVAFICVHNSCRSQIAEALGRQLCGHLFESYSAGTELVPKSNQDAVRLMKDEYGIDMEETQYSKLISDIPEVDLVVTMGCNVACPSVKAKYYEDWGLEDPSGKADIEYRSTIMQIHENMLYLRERILAGEFELKH